MARVYLKRVSCASQVFFKIFSFSFSFFLTFGTWNGLLSRILWLRASWVMVLAGSIRMTPSRRFSCRKVYYETYLSLTVSRFLSEEYEILKQ